MVDALLDEGLVRLLVLIDLVLHLAQDLIENVQLHQIVVSDLDLVQRSVRLIMDLLGQIPRLYLVEQLQDIVLVIFPGVILLYDQVWNFKE